jgi:hypothetical protein
MQGYLIELDPSNHSWTWNKWEYAYSPSGQKRVVRRKGGLEFMKMFRSLLGDTNTHEPLPSIRSQKDLEMALNKYGIEYIFLYQGETVDESGFSSVEEAERFYQLDTCTSWSLTDYWFAYDTGLQSWCMFDAYTGKLEFTPHQAEIRLKQNKQRSSLYRQDAQHAHPVNTYH